MASSECLASKLAELANPTPVLIEEDLSDTEAKVVEWDNELDGEPSIGRSVLRTQNAHLQLEEDKRYSGKKISRKKFLKGREIPEEESDEEILSPAYESDEDDEESNEEEQPEDESGEEEEEKVESSSDHLSENEDNINEDDDNEVGTDSEEEDEAENEAEEKKPQMSYFTQSQADGYMEKAKATRCQIGIWENLLETRINLQGILSSANKIPQFDVFPQFVKSGGELSSVVQSTENSVKDLMDKMMELQALCLRKNPETDKLQAGSSKKKDPPSADPDDEEITSESEPESEPDTPDEPCEEAIPLRKRMKLNDYESQLSSSHTQLQPFRDATIQKWNSRTRILSGKLNSGNFSSFDQSTLKQIEQILKDEGRLVKRTQLKRSEYQVLGKEEDKQVAVESSSTETYDPEIFDDDDFYHHLLREFIDRKSSDTSDPQQLGRKLLQLQNLRSKLKRKRDAKSSKGRKLKYDIHPKLVSFMASMFPSTMSDTARTELFSSLFQGTLTTTE